MTRVAVFGLGYVGAVTAAVLASDGHEVVGVDIDPAKVDVIARGRSPVVEHGLQELISAGVARGRLRATVDAHAAVVASEVSIVCVGTPSRSNGSLDLSYVERVCRQIGVALPAAGPDHVVVARSTMLPGSTHATVIPALEEASSLRADRDFGVCVNPEFLREGTSIRDFRNPPFTLVGGEHMPSVEKVVGLYASIQAELLVTPVAVAEMVKYTSNAFHAVKVTFANEIGAVCKAQGIDSHAVMDVFCRDVKLNVSKAYLRPGFAFGGSCLPKDVRALTYQARRLDVDTPLIGSVLESNRQQIERAFRLVEATGHRRVGVLGFSFKAGTDDLRESPLVELIERFIGKGYEVAVFDRNVSLANLQGANRAYIQEVIPHIASLMCDTVEEVLAVSDVVVIGNGSPEFATVPAIAASDQPIIDLVRIRDEAVHHPGYEGIGW